MESHAPALFPVLRDEALWEFTDEAPPESLEALRARYRRLESRCAPDGAELWLNWAIVLNDGTFVGLVQATVAASRSSVKIAYVVARSHWSHGYAQDAVSAMIAHIGESLGVAEFLASVDDRNLASGRLLARLGFVAIDSGDPKNVLWRVYRERGVVR